MVTQDENLDDCRDANEEGVTPYRGGCDSNNAPALNEPIPENDAMCWEVQKFGEPGGEEPENEENEEEEEDNANDEDNENENEVEDNEDNDNEDEDVDNQDNNEENEDENNEEIDNEDEDNEENEGEDSEDNEDDEDEEENESCEDDGSFLVRGKKNKDCEWIGKKAKRTMKFCRKKFNGKNVAESCPVTCGKC